MLVLEQLERLVYRSFVDESTLSLLMGRTAGKLDRMHALKGVQRNMYLSPPLANLVRALLQCDQLYLIQAVLHNFRYLVQSCREGSQHFTEFIPALDRLGTLSTSRNSGRTLLELISVIPPAPLPETRSPAQQPMPHLPGEDY